MDIPSEAVQHTFKKHKNPVGTFVMQETTKGGDQSKARCFIWGQAGHFARVCPKRFKTNTPVRDCLPGSRRDCPTPPGNGQ